MSDLLGVTALNWLVLAFTILGACYAAWRRVRPSVQRGSAVADAILGEPEVKDRSGNVIAPARPGLVHVVSSVDHRVTSVEEAVVEFRHLIGLWTEAQKRIDLHDARIAALERAALERIVIRDESAQMWRAVANQDVLDEETP